VVNYGLGIETIFRVPENFLEVSLPVGSTLGVTIKGLNEPYYRSAVAFFFPTLGP
jgi:hypothetical protein